MTVKMSGQIRSWKMILTRIPLLKEPESGRIKICLLGRAKILLVKGLKEIGIRCRRRTASLNKKMRMMMV